MQTLYAKKRYKIIVYFLNREGSFESLKIFFEQGKNIEIVTRLIRTKK